MVRVLFFKASKIIFKIVNMLKVYRHKHFFGFIEGHKRLDVSEKKYLYSLIGEGDAKVVRKYEVQFAKLVGSGNATSFATGRMGFFSLLNILKVGANDEVILQGSTCAVMANAILRCKATPVFADINDKTFGSCKNSIEKLISPRTKMIVAQHSFGIPCDINPISKLAQENGIFLLEDCALSLGSAIKGKRVGTFGDAALFSSDHTKPLNSLIGGLIYTSSDDLHERLQVIKVSSPDVKQSRQKQLFRQLCFEAKYANPQNFGKLRLYSAFRRKVLQLKSGFFDEDFGLPKLKSSYSYPLKLPLFLAYIGLKEVENWERTKETRKENGALFLKVLRAAGFGERLTIYDQVDIDIIPLRIAFTIPKEAKLHKALGGFLDWDSIWFREPLVGSEVSNNDFSYIAGSCPQAEKISSMMINLPCNMTSNSANILSEKLKNKLISVKLPLIGSNS